MVSNRKNRQKYGSSYDPRGGGKIERPQENFRVRGCGDPNCPSCNPETAGRGYSSYDLAAAARAVRPSFSATTAQEIWNQFMMAPPEFRDGIGNNQPSRGQQLPPSYLRARDAVEQWITEAPEQAFDDIVGNGEALSQLRDAITAPVEHKALYEAYGMTMPKGALLSGPPGCGKTMFAKAAASEMKRLYGRGNEFLSISGAELQSPYVGETEKRITQIFAFAREYKSFHGHPLLIFMDEADVLLPDRTGRVRRVASWEESQVATFLAEMDGMKENGAFVLLASNRPEVIDQAVLRDGRCDFKIVVKKPSQEAIKIILEKNFSGLKLHENTTLENIVFTAVEALHDPHKVIAKGMIFKDSPEGGEQVGGKDFCLEHIVSGAMAASVPRRALRYAFQRDKATGVASGIMPKDVMSAVDDLYEENKDMPHAYAVAEFEQEMRQEMEARSKNLN